MRLKILKDLSPTHRKFWFDENDTFSKITEISSKFLHEDEYPTLSVKMTKQEKTDFVRKELSKLNKRLPSHIYLPTNPDTKIIDILPNSAFSLQSAKKVPFIVSFIGQKYEGPDNDYIVKYMNIVEYVSTEIAAHEYTLRAASNTLPNNGVQYDVNTIHNSRILNKSTTHSIYMQNEDRLNNFTDHNNVMFTNDLLSLNDEPLMNDEGDYIHDLTVPHIDIKIFSRTTEKVDVNGELSNVEHIENGVNINDLSDCTVDEIDEEDIVAESTSIIHN